MGEREPQTSSDRGGQGAALLDLYDDALPQVYGYLLSRCGSVATAEDLTAETFLAAVSAVRRSAVDRMTVAWLITVARNKLVDHWRRRAREERTLVLAHNETVTGGHAGAGGGVDNPWDEQLDLAHAHAVLATLGSHHQAALTLRYIDGLPVPEVAGHLGRTVHATEALLVRARGAFRRAYGDATSDEDLR